MKATQLTGGVGASLALQSITSPTAAATNGAGTGNVVGAGASPVNSNGQQPASSAGGASA